MIGIGKNIAFKFLRWTERYTKTDMIYATKGGFWLFLSQGLATLFSLVLAVAFANLIEPEKYGNYKYVLSLAGIIGALTLSGLGTAVARAVARGQEGTLRYAFKMSLVWSVGMVIVSALGGAYYIFNDNYFLGFSLLIIGAVSPIIGAASLYRPFLMGKSDFKRASVYGVAQAVLPTLAVLCALLLHANLLVLVIIYFSVNAVTAWLLFKKTEQLVANSDIDPITDHLGKHLSVMGIVSAIAGKIDSILVFQILGGAELAIFSLATTVPDTIRGSFKNIDALAMPKFATKTKEEMKEAVWSKTFILLAIALGITGLYILAAPYLFTLLFPQYLAAIPYTQAYALILPMSFALASTYFDSQAAVKERYILNIVNNATKIGFTVLGIIFFGIWGAIAGRLLSRVCNIGLSAFFINRH